MSSFKGRNIKFATFSPLWEEKKLLCNFSCTLRGWNLATKTYPLRTAFASFPPLLRGKKLAFSTVPLLHANRINHARLSLQSNWFVLCWMKTWNEQINLYVNLESKHIFKMWSTNRCHNNCCVAWISAERRAKLMRGRAHYLISRNPFKILFYNAFISLNYILLFLFVLFFLFSFFS